MSSQTFSTFSEVGMIDARSQNGTITLPLTTDIPYRILTLKDIYGAAALSSITLVTQGTDVFEDGATSRILNGAFETTTLYAGQAGSWYVTGGSRLATAAIGTLSTGLIQNPLRLGTLSTQTAIQFPGLRTGYTGTVIAGQTTGVGTQELLLYQASSISDQIRLQTTGNIVFEAGASARSWPSTAALATPTLYIAGATSNIGVGTAAPATTLDVVGTGRFQTISTLALNVSSINGAAPGTGTTFTGSTNYISAALVQTQVLSTFNMTAAFASFNSASTNSLQSQFISTLALNVSSINGAAPGGNFSGSTIGLSAATIGVSSLTSMYFSSVQGYVSSLRTDSLTVGGPQGYVTIQDLTTGTVSTGQIVVGAGFISSLQINTLSFGPSGYVIVTNFIANTLSTTKLNAQNIYGNNVYVGNTSTQSAILFPGIDGTYKGTAIAEQTTGVGSQELLLYKVSSTTDQIRLQTTGNLVFEVGAPSRSWNSTTQLATPSLYIQGSTSNVGVGTAAPATTFDVVGTGRFQILSSLGLNVSSINGAAPWQPAYLTSTVTGLGTAGYISSTQLTSTVAGLTITAANAFTGSTLSLSAGTIFVSSLKMNTTLVSTMSMVDTTLVSTTGTVIQQNSILYFNTMAFAGTQSWFGQMIIPPGPPLTSIFPYTGSAQTWTVPISVNSVNAYMWAAGGGGVATASGGAGAFVQAAIPVTPGETLTLIVGGGGGVASTIGSYGGGGAGGGGGFGTQGGGRSAIQRGSVGATDYVIVGAGGGGTGYSSAGAGGPGGIAAGGAATGTTGLEGQGGTQASGGAGSSGVISAGASGTAGAGGAAGSYGGGGGAGYYGGGGSGATSGIGGSGGGGSSFVNNVLPIVLTASAGAAAPNTASAYYVAPVAAGGTSIAGTGGNGLIVLSYTAAPPATPSGLTLTLNGTTATLSWTSSGTPLYYWAFYGNSISAYSGTYLMSGSTSGTSVNYSLTATYFDYFRLVSLSPLGCISQIVSSPIIQVPAPSGLTLTAVATAVTLNWSAVSGATAYTYTLYSNTIYAYGGSQVATGSVSGVTAAYNSGVTGTYYYFTVSATTSYGTSLITTSAILQDTSNTGPFSFSGTSSLAVSSGTVYYSLLGSGTLTVSSAITTPYFAIGGGGGGGSYYGGGGGAGGLLQGSITLATATNYTVTIGSGGAGTPYNGGTVVASSNGANTVISGGALSTITALGGGAGANSTTAPGVGGCGGGGAGGGYYTGALGTAGQGYGGGSGGGNGSSGAGGGGVGGAGTNGIQGGLSGNGGIGITYAGGQYGGGGGGAGSGTASYGGGVGGTINSLTLSAGSNGSPNTGGGGGSGTYNGDSGPHWNAGGTGGSGIVILSFVTPVAPTGLALTPAVGNTATLSWTASSGATGYNWVVYQSATNGYFGTSFSTGSTNSTTYTATVTGLNMASYYYFTVVASGAVNSAAAVSAIMYELPDAPTPTLTTTGTTLNMSWTSISGALYYTYTVYQGTSYAYSGTQVATADNGTSLSATYTGISTNYYYFTVSVTTSAGTSALSTSGIAQAQTPLYLVTATTPSSTAITPAYSGGNYIYSFTTTGSNTFVLGQAYASAQYLIVAGGGGGGAFSAGGGGGGGVLSGTTSLSAATYTVVVGAGGSGATQSSAGVCTALAKQGSNSVFNSLTAIGGGLGGTDQTVTGVTTPNGNGGSGGSGGGGGGGSYNSTGGSGTAGPPIQGYAGGNNSPWNNTPLYSASGGGAGGAASGYTPGPGISNSITGSAQYYAGGGGAGRLTNNAGTSNIPTVAGGIGGGGTGGMVTLSGSLGYIAGSGTPNTGGGGGGGADQFSQGGNGGSGIVIVSLSGSISLGAPTNPILVTSGGSATLSWTAAAGATGYSWNLYQSSSNNYVGTSFTTGTTTSATTASATGLTLGLYYYFTVIATATGGSSPAAASAIVLEQITGASALALSITYLNATLSWTGAGTSPTFYYTLYQNTSNSYTVGTIITLTTASTTATSVTYSFTPSSSNYYYYYSIYETTSSGTSATTTSPIVRYPPSFTWTIQSGAGSRQFNAVTSSASGSNLAAAVGSGYMYTSTDAGVTWTAQTSVGTRGWGWHMASSSNGAVLLAGESSVFLSVNSGVTWVAQSSAGTGGFAYAVSSDGTKLFVGGTPGYIYTSSNTGSTWVQQTGSGSRNWYSLACSYDGTKVVGIESTGYVYTSADSGVTWSQRAASTSGNRVGVACSADASVIVAPINGGYIYTSSDSGATWTSRTGPGTGGWWGCTCSSNGISMTVCAYPGYIYSSIDGGVTWTQQTAAGSNGWWGITASYDGTRVVGVQNIGALVTGLLA